MRRNGAPVSLVTYATTAWYTTIVAHAARTVQVGIKKRTSQTHGRRETSVANTKRHAEPNETVDRWIDGLGGEEGGSGFEREDPCGSTRSHARCSRRMATPHWRARARRAAAEWRDRGFGYPVTPGERPAQQRRRGRACWGETRRWFAPARCREHAWRDAILRSGAYRNGKGANAE